MYIVYRQLRQQDELSIRERTEDNPPTTSTLQKEAIRSPFHPLLGLHKKENRFFLALFGACFLEKLTTEDWPGPVLASLNMCRPKDTVNQETTEWPEI